jgi:hypothetical protein
MRSYAPDYGLAYFVGGFAISWLMVLVDLTIQRLKNTDWARCLRKRQAAKIAVRRTRTPEQDHAERIAWMQREVERLERPGKLGVSEAERVRWEWLRKELA